MNPVVDNEQLSLNSQSNFLPSDVIQVAWALLGCLPDQLVNIVLGYHNPMLDSYHEILNADQLAEWIASLRLGTWKMLHCKKLRKYSHDFFG